MKQSLLSFLVLCTLLFVGGGIAQAQNRTITGRVSSSLDGNPIGGATVSVIGTSTTTQTNNSGDYTVTVPQGNTTLLFSSVGYEDQSIEVGNRTTINITLQSSETALDEVIVVAYGTVNKATHVGSSAQISAADFEDRPITNVTSALVGAAPGIQGTLAGGSPGSGADIRVRGFGSISANNGPLYVVDGVPYDGGTANINPDDVASVSVLKDASTTALYGSRGANGVIMITTKQGKSGQSNFTVNASVGAISRGLPEYDRVDALDYYPLMWEALRNSLVTTGIPTDIANSIAAGQTTSYDGNNYSGVYNMLNYNPFNVPNDEIVGLDGRLNPNARLLYPDDLDWERDIQRGGKSRQAYNIAYDGGTEKTDYFASLGYTDDRGYLLKSDLKRINGRVNVNTRPTNWLKTGVNLTANHNISNFENTSGNTSAINPFYISRFIGPIYPVYEHDPTTGDYVYDENGNRLYDMGDNRPFWGGRNAIMENELDQQQATRSAWGGRTYLEVNILPELTAKTSIGFDVQDIHEREYDNPIIGDGSPAGRNYHYFRKTTSYTWNQTLEYNKSFNGLHNLNVLAGHENYARKFNYLTGSRSEMIVDGITELPNFATILGTSSYEDNSTIESYFSRVSYDYDQKYVLSASLRRDGNSRFHPDFRWETFWSVGGAYNIERENFFNVSSIDMLKLRATYGVVGNEAGLGYYPYQALYTLGRNNAAAPGFTQRSLPNDSLTWETAKNFDVGIDFAMFGNRLSGSIEYFDRKTDGLIFAVPVPLMNGGVVNVSPYYHEIDKNIGSLYNRGFEASFTGVIVRNENFNYSTTLNLTHFKNQITKMPDGQPLIQSGTKGYSVGHSIYDFYLRDFYGVNPDNGDALYRTDIETANTTIVGTDTLTPIISEANFRYINKSSIPDLYGSMFHNFGYKNFTLSLMFTYQIGGYMYDNGYASLMSAGSYGQAMHADLLTQRWQQTGDQTNTPRLDAGRAPDLSGQSSRFLTSASYFNLNNVTIGYSLPKHLLNAAGIKDLYIFASGENLGLLSARKGMNVMGSFAGTTSNSYNFNRLITFGTRIKF